jgi:hypothetical protein
MSFWDWIWYTGPQWHLLSYSKLGSKQTCLQSVLWLYKCIGSGCQRIWRSPSSADHGPQLHDNKYSWCPECCESGIVSSPAYSSVCKSSPFPLPNLSHPPCFPYSPCQLLELRVNWEQGCVRWQKSMPAPPQLHICIWVTPVLVTSVPKATIFKTRTYPIGLSTTGRRIHFRQFLLTYNDYYVT